MVLNPNASATQTVNLISTTIFNLAVTDQVTGCEGEADEVVVQVIGGPLAVMISSDKPAICEGESAVLTAYPSGGNMGNYTFTWSDGLGNSYPSTGQITVSPAGSTTYYVIVNDGYNTIEDSFDLTVYPSTAFNWSVAADPVMACPADSVLLKPVPQMPGWSYLWSNGSAEDQITVGVTGIGFSLQTYTLTTTSTEGCSYSKSIQVIFDFSYCSGIDDSFPDNLIKISPNPGIGLFKAEILGKNDFEILSVFNILSGKVLEKNIEGITDEIEIDLTRQPEGLYLVRLTGAYSVAYCKILISR